MAEEIEPKGEEPQQKPRDSEMRRAMERMVRKKRDAEEIPIDDDDTYYYITNEVHLKFIGMSSDI